MSRTASSTKSPTPDAAKFAVDDRVLVTWHTPKGVRLYDGKVLKRDEHVQRNTKSFRYQIHYTGWNSRHDDWVAESKMQRFDEAKYREHRAEVDASKRKRKSQKRRLASAQDGSDNDPSTSRPSTPSMTKRSIASNDSGERRKRYPCAPSSTTADSTASGLTGLTSGVVMGEMEQAYRQQSSPEIEIRIPDDLKHILVDDWDSVTRQSKLVEAPAQQTVEKILLDYRAARCKGLDDAEEGLLNEVTAGIMLYFDTMLDTQLLYKFERAQHAGLQATHPKRRMSTCYGAEHLLRLFVRLGHLLSYTPLSEKQVDMLLTHFNDILAYLSEQKADLFRPENYVTASSDYMRLSGS